MTTKKGKGKDKEEKLPVASKNALQIMADRLNVSAEQLRSTLKATILKDVKVQGGTKRPATDAEFITFIAVANAYNLNPLTKEIYAFPDKSGGIVPIVSTDGWTKLITKHPMYKNHTYIYSEDVDTPKGGKECPEWIEIHIKKQDNEVIVIREYLDECFRDLSYTNPWQTHTKRMMRHKTKIQGGREAFGLVGIYDRDEAEKIIEAEFEEVPSKAESVEIEEEETPEITHDTPEEAGDGTLPLGDKQDDANKSITPESIKKLQTLFSKDKLDMDRDMRLANISVRLGKKVETIKDLNEKEGKEMIEVFEVMVKNQGK